MQTSQKGQFFFVLTLLPRLFTFRNWRIFGSCVFFAPLDWYIGRHLGRHIGWHSTDVSIDISAECRLICRSTYRSSVGRYVDRDVSVDVSTDVSYIHTYIHTYIYLIKQVNLHKNGRVMVDGRHIDRLSADISVDIAADTQPIQWPLIVGEISVDRRCYIGQ